MLSQLTDGVLKQTRTFQRADFMNEYEFEAYGNSSLHYEFSFLKDKNRGAIKHIDNKLLNLTELSLGSSKASSFL